MSSYTSELRFICESEIGLTESTGYSSINTVITKAIPKIFNFDFPIFDEKYRNVLLAKILKHFYTREIGEESYGLWKLRLDTKLNEIMPYYNKLYQSELIEFNPMYTTNMHNEHQIDGKGNQKTLGDVNRTDDLNKDIHRNLKTDDYVYNEPKVVTTTTLTKGTSTKDAYSDTPQGQLNNVEGLTYLTNYRKVTDEGTDTTVVTPSNMDTEHTKLNQTTNGYDKNTGTQKHHTDMTVNDTSFEKYVEDVTGYNGTNASDLLLKFRKTFLNIDMLVINELEPLFIQLW